MPTLAVKLFDPAGQEWAQLLDADERIRRLVPVLVGRLDLPEDLHYELLERVEGRTLHPEDTLPEAGIHGGEELLLRPVTDAVLTDFLDALYDEAIGFVAGKAFEGALGRLETLYRLDPDYPDREGLWRKVARNTPAGGSGAAASSGRGPRGGSKGASGARAAARLSSPGRAGGSSGRAASGGGSCLIQILAFAVVATFGVWVSGGCERIDLTEWPPVVVDPPPPPPPPPPYDDDTVVVGDTVVRTGDVRVTLQWDNPADVDLHVTDPTGDEINYAARTAESGGELDVDANGACGGDPQVENVFWPAGGAPRGTYRVAVVHYKPCSGSGPTRYTVTAYLDERQVQQRTGTIGPSTRERVEAFEFDL